MPLFGKGNQESDARKRIIQLMHASIGYSKPPAGYDAIGCVKWPCADLAGVDLSRLNMSYAGGTDLGGANLRGAILEGSNLNDADLSNADLSGIRARGLFLSGANLTGADFTDADLRDANLNNVLLGGAVFVRTDLRGARGFYQRNGGPPAVFQDCLGEEYVLQQLSNR